MSTLAPLLAFLVTILPAQVVTEVADQVEFRGYYLDEGTEVSIDGMEELVATHPDTGFVALVETPAGGADLFADQVLAEIGQPDTVIVLTPDEAGAASAIYADEALDAAFDEAFSTTGDAYQTDFAEVAAALAGAPAGTPVSDGGGFPIGTVVAAVVLAGVGLILWHNQRRDRKTSARHLETARTEIRAQLAAAANQILEWSDRAELDANPEAVEHFRRGTAIFDAAEPRLGLAVTPVDLEKLSDDLDLARWELAAAEALVEGRPVPSRPEDRAPDPCFFDPTHGAGVEPAEIKTATGDRSVMVCRADAERLRRGERPEPRTIDVGGRRVPAPQAPRTHGGRGLDWLDGFSILVGGMGDPLDYRWGTPSRGGPGRGGVGGFGGRSSVGRSSGVRSSRPSRSVGRARRGR